MSDADLAELEALEREMQEEENQKKNNKGEEDEEVMDIDDLEKEINDMNDDNQQKPVKKKVAPKPTPTKPKTLPLDVIEKTFHSPGLFFSDLIDFEINKILPILRKKYDNDDNAMDLLIYLNKKEGELFKFKSAIMKKVQNGDIDETKYIMILKKVLNANNQTLIKAKKLNLDKLNIGRIEKRINTLAHEISAVNSEINYDTAEVDAHGKEEGHTVQPTITESSIADFKKKDEVESEINHKKKDDKKKEDKKEDKKEGDKKKGDKKKDEQKKLDEKKEAEDGLAELEQMEKEENKEKDKKKEEGKNPDEKKKEEKNHVEKIKEDPEIDHETIAHPPRITAYNTNPVFLHFAQKISMIIAIRDYFFKHWDDNSRETAIKRINHYISCMKKKLEQMKKDPEFDSIDSLEREFPDLTLEFIVGITVESRNAKIKEIVLDIKNDINDCKKNNKRMFQVFDKYYNAFFKKLMLIKSKVNIPFPKIEKLPTPFPHKEINTNIERGNLIMKINNIKVFKKQRFYYLKAKLKYEDKEFNYISPYCENGGHFGVSHRFHLEDSRLKPRVSKCTVVFNLYKRKMLVTSRHVSQVEVSLAKVLNYANFTETLAFEYKDGKTLYVDVTFSIHNALTNKYLVDLNLYKITKLYPPFEPPKKRSEKHCDHDHKDHSEEEEEEKPEPKVVPKVEPKKQEPKKKPKQKNDVDSIENAKFKYPLLTPKEKAGLKRVLAKYKFPSGYIDYQEKIFCVSFLEDFSKELETQITSYNLKGDFKMAKEASSIFGNANKYMNYFSSKLEEGEMTMDQYKELVDNFISVDEKQLDFFTKIKFAKSVTFITNRLKLMKKESGDLATMMAG